MNKILEWLQNKDACILFAVKKYLLNYDEKELIQIQKTIENQGYAKIFLNSRNSDGL